MNVVVHLKINNTTCCHPGCIVKYEVILNDVKSSERMHSYMLVLDWSLRCSIPYLIMSHVVTGLSKDALSHAKSDNKPWTDYQNVRSTTYTWYSDASTSSSPTHIHQCVSL